MKKNKYSTFIHASFVSQHLAKILTDCLSQHPLNALKAITDPPVGSQTSFASRVPHQNMRRLATHPAVVADRGDGMDCGLIVCTVRARHQLSIPREAIEV